MFSLKKLNIFFENKKIDLPSDYTLASEFVYEADKNDHMQKRPGSIIYELTLKDMSYNKGRMDEVEAIMKLMGYIK